MTKQKIIPKTFEPGQWVVVAIKDSKGTVAGEVQAVDEHGIRVTHMDWLLGSMCGVDRFIPWDKIGQTIIYTEAHNKESYKDQAAAWNQSDDASH